MSTKAETAVDPASESAEDVLALLRRQAQLYGRLEALTETQKSLVTGDDVGPLLSLLAERQKLSDALVHVAGRLAPIRRSWASSRTQLPPPQRAEADRLVHETGQRLERLIENDTRDARVLFGRRHSVAKALRMTHSTGEAMSAYRTAPSSAGRLDLVSDGDR